MTYCSKHARATGLDRDAGCTPGNRSGRCWVCLPKEHASDRYGDARQWNCRSVTLPRWATKPPRLRTFEPGTLIASPGQRTVQCVAVDWPHEPASSRYRAERRQHPAQPGGNLVIYDTPGRSRRCSSARTTARPTNNAGAGLVTSIGTAPGYRHALGCPRGQWSVSSSAACLRSARAHSRTWGQDRRSGPLVVEIAVHSWLLVAPSPNAAR